MSKLLAASDFDRVAAVFDVPASTLYALAEVESAGDGFLQNGHPKILFEGHWFWRRLKHYGFDPAAILAANPDAVDVLHPTWERNYIGGVGEYQRLGKALAIDPTEGTSAGFESASWGKFQVMGFHWEALGYESVGQFVSFMHRSEADHLDACLRFCEKNGLLPALRARDFVKVARVYNGAGYAQNRYHTRLAEADAQAQRRLSGNTGAA